MIGLLKLFLLSTIGYATVTDSHHMQSCVVCVRDAVSAAHSIIDGLTHQADGKVETVILYLLRVCYFSMNRTEGEYSVEKLYTLATRSVPSFTHHEFKVLEEITRMEAFARIDDKLKTDYWTTDEWGIPTAIAVITFASMFFLIRRKGT